MKLFSDGWTGILRKQLTGHTNEKGRQIRIDTVGGKTIWLTNRVWDVPTNIFYFLCNQPFLLSYTTQSKIAVPLSEKPAPKKVTKKAHESANISNRNLI